MDFLAVSSILVLYKTYSGSLTNETSLLYVFETGIPILVTFKGKGEITAIATLIFSNQFNTLSNTREIFEPYGCDVSNFNIN